MKAAFLHTVSLAPAMVAVDGALMSFYRNMRRFSQVALAVMPLVLLLVGSCKTSQLPGAYGSSAGPAQFRTALFPDRVNFRGVNYYPAEGYVARARKFVEGDPRALALLTEREIGYLFGKPSMRRRDADAQIWQYKTAVCVVDFYFYDDAKEKDAAAMSYMDVRLKKELAPGSAPRAGELPEKTRAKCIKNIIDEGDFASSRA